LYSCTIITTQASEIMAPIHERMPVIITPEHYSQWLDKSTDENETFELLDNQAYGLMTATPVSDWVNNPMHNDERCVQPL
jgi:putative SOS response-associated peptidase YedK